MQLCAFANNASVDITDYTEANAVSNTLRSAQIPPGSLSVVINGKIRLARFVVVWSYAQRAPWTKRRAGGHVEQPLNRWCGSR
ncbi:MAG: hypothetical protein JWL97_4266 [Gemmatimonadales bacterium]|nr:hypothetical protein [Gemmatimonadales bacterium]